LDNLAAQTSNITKQMLALLICCFLASCAPAVTLPHAPDLVPDQLPAPHDSRWEKLSGRNQVRSGLRAMADIDLTTEDGRRHLRVAMLLQLPSLLRIESIPLFGPPDLFLSLNREKLKIFLPGKNEFYQGRPSRENLSRFLPLSLSPTDMVYVLLGLPPPPPVTEVKFGYRESRAGDRQRLDLFLNNRIIRTLWSDSNVERLTDMEIIDADTKLTHRISYGNYLRLGESDWPQRVTIASPDGKARIIVNYDDMELCASEDEEIFDLLIPRGVTPTGMDSDDTPETN
jgi:hypothetical protein